jgi:hypothetical protein
VAGFGISDFKLLISSIIVLFSNTVVMSCFVCG